MVEDGALLAVRTQFDLPASVRQYTYTHTMRERLAAPPAPDHQSHRLPPNYTPPMPTPLRIGLDLDDTITAAPAAFRGLAAALIRAGCEVHIVTYRPDSSPEAVAADLAELGVEWTRIHLPRGFGVSAHAWKRAVAAAAALDLLIDDDLDVIQAAAGTTVALRYTAPDARAPSAPFKAMPGGA